MPDKTNTINKVDIAQSARNAAETNQQIERLRLLAAKNRKENFQATLNIIPQMAEIAGTTIQDFCYFLKPTLSPILQNSFTLSWHATDAVCAIMLGISQLLDDDNYRQKQMKAKGLLNIISGVKLTLTSISLGLNILTAPTPMSSVSYALTTLIHVLKASVEVYNSYKEISFEGWLEEKTDHLIFVKKQIEKIDVKLKSLNSQVEQNQDVSKDITKLQAKKNLLENTLETETSNFVARCRHHRRTDEKYQPEGNNNPIYKQLVKLHMAAGIELKQQICVIINGQKNPEETNQSTADKKINDNIQQKLEATHSQNKTELALKFASFIGASCIAASLFVIACPPVAITLFSVGLALTTGVSATYLNQYRKKIITFFQASKPAEEDKKDAGSDVSLAPGTP